MAHKSANRAQTLKEARNETLKTWQREWDCSEKGKWMHTQIRKVEKWTGRRHGDIDFNLTQALTNHGCFNEYLYKIKKIDNPKCSLSDADNDDVNHTLFVCDTLDNWRRQLFREMGYNLTPDNLVDNMLQEKGKWQTSTGSCSSSARTKEDERGNK